MVVRMRERIEMTSTVGLLGRVWVKGPQRRIKIPTWEVKNV
jgi:hypothetical protein